MNFQILALPRDEFAPLFALADAQLQARAASDASPTASPASACRVSLEDAAPGESLVLIPFTHQSADSPCRASGPIFVREMARQASLGVNEVPEQLRGDSCRSAPTTLKE